MRKNLSYEQIISAALCQIEETGYDSLSMRQIASRLCVKPASLYNHVGGIDDVRVGIAVYAAEQLEARLSLATSCENRDTAFVEGAIAYRAFATERPELYRAYITTRGLDDPRVVESGKRSFTPLVSLIKKYGLNGYEALNFQRALRSAIHGYIELCNNGFMTRGGVSRDESYSAMINEHLKVLHLLEGQGKESRQ